MSVDFLDSNIFIYSQDETDAYKRETAERLIQEAVQTRRGAVSHQVVEETLNVLTTRSCANATPPKRDASWKVYWSLCGACTPAPRCTIARSISW